MDLYAGLKLRQTKPYPISNSQLYDVQVFNWEVSQICEDIIILSHGLLQLKVKREEIALYFETKTERLYAETLKGIIDDYYEQEMLFYHREDGAWYSREHSRNLTPEEVCEWVKEITKKLNDQ